MWVTLINLTGEAPLCDYTLAGRCIVSFMMLVAEGRLRGSFCITVRMARLRFSEFDAQAVRAVRRKSVKVQRVRSGSAW